MSRSRDLGTRWETNCVAAAQNRGLMSDRHPQRGINDTNDIWIAAEDEWWVECKYTTTDKSGGTLNPHRVLEKAIAKSDDPYHTALLWRRMDRRGRERAVQMGEPLAFMSDAAWLVLTNSLPAEQIYHKAYTIHTHPEFPVWWFRGRPPGIIVTTRDHFLDLLWESTNG